MNLSLEEFDRVFDWNDAEILYLQMVGNSIHMDVNFITYKQSKRNSRFSSDCANMKMHIIFKNVSLFTDYYYSSLNKIIDKFTCPYLCSSNKLNEDGELVIDDCVRIKCEEVQVEELSH